MPKSEPSPDADTIIITSPVLVVEVVRNRVENDAVKVVAVPVFSVACPKTTAPKDIPDIKITINTKIGILVNLPIYPVRYYHTFR